MGKENKMSALNMFSPLSRSDTRPAQENRLLPRVNTRKKLSVFQTCALHDQIWRNFSNPWPFGQLCLLETSLLTWWKVALSLPTLDMSDHVTAITELDKVTTSHLAGQNIPKRWECVIKCLVINGFVQVLNEDIPNPWLPQGGVPLRPHDANGFSFDHIKIHGI